MFKWFFGFNLTIIMKYFIHLAYKGTNYRGWQRQPNSPSIQAVLEDSIAKMMGQKINCIPCGRTDAGVHARHFFCHLVVENAFDFDPVFRLNKMLPNDICIYDFLEVSREVHAQHGAISRTYEYFIHTKKDPFLSEISAYYSKKNLDLEKMKKAAELISEASDFKAFCKQPDLYKNTQCIISNAEIKQLESKQQIRFRITANRFLRGMVRILVGNILEVGYGKLELHEFENCLKNGIRPAFFKEAYPQGLYLTEVKYLEEVFL
jgi:tRNA pseudouridine38-40 synthase